MLTNRIRDFKYVSQSCNLNDNVEGFENEIKLFEQTMPPYKFKIIKIISNDKFNDAIYGTKTPTEGSIHTHQKCYSRVLDITLQDNIHNIKQLNSLDEIEQILFHGTSWQNMQKILQNGFDSKFNARRVYGKGLYFAKSALYSHNYTKPKIDGDERCMVVAKVIVGKYCQGQQHLTFDHFGDKIDSFVDNIHYPNIFVAKDYHCVPHCVIVYRETNI